MTSGTTVASAPTGVDAAPSASSGRRRRRAEWLAVVPLLVFVAVAFGIPALAMLNGAFTVKDPATGATSYTTANLTASLHGAYLTALLGSVKLSAVSAAIAMLLGLLLAQAVVVSASAHCVRPYSPPPGYSRTSAVSRSPSPSSRRSATLVSSHATWASPTRAGPCTASGA